MSAPALLHVRSLPEPLLEFLSRECTVMRVFGERKDSKSTVVGVECEGERYVVKACWAAGHVDDIANAIEVHRAVRHQAIVPVLHSFPTGDGGLAIVMPWASGTVLHDAFDPSVLRRDDAASPYRRFLALGVGDIVDAWLQIVDAHVAVVDAGLVAVDLFDGCVVYDFDSARVSLVDLDHYRPPYVLDCDRQLGSSSYMAPEEFVRGASIDQRTTVFTLGRMALVYLGCSRSGAPSRADFRGGDAHWKVLLAATATRPEDRVPSVQSLREAF